MSDLITKLYIEPTSHCNLSCPMCSRNYWVDEKMGHMEYSIFQKVISEAKEIESIHTVFFGGIGEPLVQPRIIDMIKAAKAAGKNAELITNGLLLNEDMVVSLIDSGLDRIWISIDSVDLEEYQEIRRGGDYLSLKDNLVILKNKRIELRSSMKAGVSFVLMKKNAEQLAKLTSFARKYFIEDIKITNLIPNTREMVDEILYSRTLSLYPEPGSMDIVLNIDLPNFDIQEELKEPLYRLMRNYANFSLMGQEIKKQSGYCRFINEGNVFIRWDGEVCPCMALIHTGKTYLHDTERTLKAATFGNIKNATLQGIWDSEAYASFRDRVKKFEFSPCTRCGGCGYLESNETDCFGNTSPVCGGCLWAQGYIQCP